MNILWAILLILVSGAMLYLMTYAEDHWLDNDFDDEYAEKDSSNTNNN